MTSESECNTSIIIVKLESCCYSNYRYVRMVALAKNCLTISSMNECLVLIGGFFPGLCSNYNLKLKLSGSLKMKQNKCSCNVK